MIYEWDETKRLTNIEKHGYDLSYGDLVYESLDKVTSESHHSHEHQWCDVAMIEGELMALTLTYTVRGNAVRFISLRKASRKERRHYLWAKSLE
ncbi:MAG: BrnT family toxin [Deltaproteobacteria bacterium]|jgi:uncharacterized DUF497 family protein